MIRGILLDTNFLIKALDTESGTPLQDRRKAQQRLFNWESDVAVETAITPLIRYEFLRHVEFGNGERYAALQAGIDGVRMLHISREVSDLAINLFRFDTFETKKASSEKNIDKRKFDAFHFAAAKCNGYEIASDDSDIEKLESLYARLIDASNVSSIQQNTNNTNNEENT